MSEPHIAVDFETYYDEDYSVKVLGNWAYCQDPRFDPYLISVCDGERTWVGHPAEFNWESLRGRTLISHNAFFDRTVYRRLVELGIAPAGLDGDWQCSSNLSAYFCGSTRNLRFAAGLLLKVAVDKDVRDRAKGKTAEEMRSEGWWPDMLKYARRDAQLCWEIWDKYNPQWPASERRLSDLAIRNSERGIAVDVPKLDEYIVALQKALFQTELQIPWVADGEKPTSPKSLAAACRAEGIPVPPTKKDDEEGVDLWLKTYEQKFSWVRAVGAWRSINKTLKRFLLVRARVNPATGRMDFGLKYFGAVTGRYSGDAGWNAQNQRKEPILLTVDWLMETRRNILDEAFAHEDEHGKYPDWVGFVIDERSLLIPGPGKKFVISDLSQIEPRVLNTLIGNHALLDRIRAGMAIYEAFARTALGYTDPAPLKSKDKRLYALSKAEVLGLGYQCGPKRFPEVAWLMARLRITEEESTTAVAAFRKDNPDIVALWARLDAAFKSSVGGDFTLGLPSGRTMVYRDVKAMIRPELDEETGVTKLKRVYTAFVGERRTTLYGGKLTENLVQAVARDIFVEILLLLDDAGIHVPFSVHDEAVCEVDVDFDKGLVEKIMSTAPAWFLKCPVACEAVEATAYQK